MGRTKIAALVAAVVLGGGMYASAHDSANAPSSSTATTTSQVCLMLDTGNKVCGADATAWCTASEAGRQADMLAPGAVGTQGTCDELTSGDLR